MRALFHHRIFSEDSLPLKAVAVVVGSVATLGYMYVVGKQMKAEEGPASIFSKLSVAFVEIINQPTYTTSESPEQSGGLGSNESDVRMDSKAVRETVQGERKP